MSRDGTLKIGVGKSFPIELREFDRGAICSLGWADGRLAYLGSEGLKVAHFGAASWPERLDTFATGISSFQMTTEGTLLFDAEGGHSRLIDWRQAPEGAGKANALTVEAAPDLGVDASGKTPSRVESSSIRPHFMRRPAEATVSAPAGPSAASVRLFSNVPQARAVDAQPSSVAAGGPSASQLSGAEAAVVEHPLSQATSVPLYQLYSQSSTDHFYTVSASQRDLAISYGYLNQGIAAYVEPTQVAGTLPFWRFYSGSQSDHFYTTSAAEYNYVVANGFTYETVEGYLYSGQVAGTVPLYRLSWWNSTTNDLDHFYTTSDASRNSVIAQGWTYDGVAGYVWLSAGPPPGPPNGAAFVSQSVPASMVLGQSYPVSVTMRNTGTNTWTAASAHHLGSQNPQDNGTWGLGRVYLPYDVPPGASVTFAFTATPPGAGVFNFQWRMVQDGVEWFGDLTQNVSVAVLPPSAINAAVFVSQSVPGSMVLGQSYPVSVTMRNTGTNTWTAASAHHLGSQNPQDNGTWGLGRVYLPYDVPPGANVTFAFTATPASTGSLNFQWRMVQDGVEWFGDFSPNVSVAVQQQSTGPALHRWYSASSTDHFYSLTDYGTSLGGFAPQGIAGYMAPGPGPGTLAFRRFYNGYPRSEHFYTTDAGEAAYVVNSLGFVDEGIEGYLFTSPQPGTVPFYRLSWCGGGGDCDHIYTAWPSEKDQVISLGWGLDGVQGYVGAPPGGPPGPPAPPPQNDDAAFVSQSVPALMTAGLPKSVSLTLRNTGATTWTAAAGYQLSSQNPQDNLAWGLARVALPGSVSAGRDRHLRLLRDTRRVGEGPLPVAHGSGRQSLRRRDPERPGRRRQEPSSHRRRDPLRRQLHQ